eukprot:858395-Pyramimonas_sp.AAC.1
MSVVVRRRLSSDGWQFGPNGGRLQAQPAALLHAARANRLRRDGDAPHRAHLRQLELAGRGVDLPLGQQRRGAHLLLLRQRELHYLLRPPRGRALPGPGERVRRGEQPGCEPDTPLVSASPRPLGANPPKPRLSFGGFRSNARLGCLATNLSAFRGARSVKDARSRSPPLAPGAERGGTATTTRSARESTKVVVSVPRASGPRAEYVYARMCLSLAEYVCADVSLPR